MSTTRQVGRSRVAVAAAVLAGGLLLTACGGSDGSSGSSAGGSAADPGSAAKVAAPEADGAQDATSGQSRSSASGSAGGDQQAAAVVDAQKIIRTADLSVQARDVAAALVAVRRAVAQADGYVADEKTSLWQQPGPAVDEGTAASPSEGTATSGTTAGPADTAAPVLQSVLTARVPNASLDRVMQQVGATGTVLSRDQSSTDVTTKVVDTTSRVATQRASVERVRALLARATTIGQVVQVEGELSRREADLESLEAQLKSLQDRTSLSTLTVTLTPVGAAPVPQRHDHGFVAGLHSGWSAFTATTTALLTALGAVLPFLVLVALVLGPVAVWVRRRRPAVPTTPQVQPTP